jgi:hypothetical protein
LLDSDRGLSRLPKCRLVLRLIKGMSFFLGHFENLLQMQILLALVKLEILHDVILEVKLVLAFPQSHKSVQLFKNIRWAIDRVISLSIVVFILQFYLMIRRVL